jgi:hypothetical protein
MSNDDLRARAEKSLKKKQEFWQYIGVYIGVNAMLTGVWFFTMPGGYFWPVWVLFGMGIAIPIIGFEAYGPGKSAVSEAKIQAEMKRLSGES